MPQNGLMLVHGILRKKPLNENPELKLKLEAKIKADPEFAKDKMAHLNFIWENSKFVDRTENWYPIVRIN